VNYFRRIFAFN